MYDEVRRLMPHALRSGHVVGPRSGIALDTVESYERLDAQRQELSELRKNLQRHLDQGRPAGWKDAPLPAGTHKVWYKPKPMASFELRDEAVVLDVLMYPFALVENESVVHGDGYKVGTLYERDERTWSSFVRRQRSFTQRFVGPQEEFAKWYAAPHESAGVWWKQLKQRNKETPSTSRRALFFALILPFLIYRLLVKLNLTIVNGLIAVQRKVFDMASDLPLILKEGAIDTRAEMSTQGGRRGLLRAMFDDQYMTPERRRVILFLTSIVFFLAWLLADLLIATYPEAVQPKRTTDQVFGYAFATRLILPTPFEPILWSAVGVLGFVMTVIVAAIGATVGGWLLFIIGGEAAQGFERIIENNRPARAAFRWLERNAKRGGMGYILLGLVLAIPFSPDMPPLMLATMLRLKMKLFLVTVFISGLLRFSLTVLLAPA